jgi:thiol-disulfide isomerase/thioredoxin
LASNFILKDLSGDTLELYKIKDKYILLDFSTLYCGKCHVALSYLIKQKDSLMSMPLDIIIIDCDKKSDKVKLSKYITENKIPYPILLDGLKVSLKYKAFSNPTFVLIDKDKVIIDMMIGFKEESFKRMIEKINK